MRETATTVRGLTVLIGEPLLQEASKIADVLSPNLAIPHTLTTAIRRVDGDRDARLRRSGAFIGDSGDVARRRLNGPFRGYLRTLPAKAPAVILFEPEGDFDFDTLKVVRASLERSGRRPFVFAFPQVMEADDRALALARARLRELPGGAAMNMSQSSPGLRMGYYVGPNASLSQLKRSREKVLGFLTALSWSSLLTSPPRPRSNDPDFAASGEMTLKDGLRVGRESLEAAIDRVLDTEPYARSERRFILLRHDAFNSADVAALAGRSRRGEQWDLSSYPVRAGHEAQFFIASGPVQSPLWTVMRDMGSET